MRLQYLTIVLCNLVFFFLVLPAQAQTAGSVSGKLTDNNNSPVSYVNVTLLRTDSTVANGDLTKDDGAFRITPVNTGNYLLRIESLGFETKYVSVSLPDGASEKKLGTIKLSQTQQSLKAVEITGEKRVMELKVDKKVFNVEKNITTAGGSATDVLQNVPAVSVDMDGNVSLRGKSNVTILIDGKPATMLGSDVASALQSLPAGSIESVEVITNPSAKYDAQGTTGIINIVTKKDGRLGINGNVTLGAGTRDKYNANLGLNIRKGKWSTFFNSSGRINRTFHNVTTQRLDEVMTNGNRQSYYTYEHVPRLFNGLFNTIGATYDIDKNNAITLTQNVNFMQWGFKDYSDYTIYSAPNEGGQTLVRRDRYSDMLGSPVSFSTAFDYKHKFRKKGEEINIDATYASMAVDRTQNFRTILDTNGVYAYNIRSSAPGSGGNNSLNVWADYTNPLFTANGKLGLGFKTQIFNFYSSNNPILDTLGKAAVVDSSLFTIYDYTQQIHAAYINWSDQQDKFSYQAGLRVENAIYDGTGSIPRPAEFSNSFLNLFPSAFVAYQLPSDQSIYLNYSRRTNRPGYFQMMPFKDYSNPGTVSMGNPDILPEFIDNIEFSYSRNTPKGNTFIASTYFARTNNLSERVIRPITGSKEDSALGLMGEVGQLLSMPMNIAYGTTFGLEGTGRLQITKAWDATVNVNFFNNELTVGNIDPTYSAFISNNNGYGWFGKINSNVKLPENFSLQFNGNYESPKVITQGRQQESYWLDVAVKKNLWKNKASLTVNCSDVFKTRQFINNYNTAIYTQTINRVKETRIGNITFTYRFGKSDAGKNGGGADRGRGGKKAESKKVEKPSDEDRVNNLKRNEDGDNGGGGGGGGGSKGGR
ncbi:MAG: TonB-dependent receptor [Taibaiella sp.]|nr:TonB-dependent receptor [Taibaiella sp.]